MITLPKSGGCIVTPDAGAMPAWKIALEQIKHRKLNLQVAELIEQERRDALREHGDRVRFETIKNMTVGK